MPVKRAPGSTARLNFFELISVYWIASLSLVDPKMDITQSLAALACQIQNTSETLLSPQELRQVILEQPPGWLPQAFYDPRQTYQPGQRLFHAAPPHQDWFTILDVLGDLLCVRFDRGMEATLFHRGAARVDFPTCPEQYLLEKLNDLDLAALRQGWFRQKIVRRFGITAFYRLEPLDHLEGILKDGFQPRSRSRGESDPLAGLAGDNPHTPGAPALRLSDCVPFNAAPRPAWLGERLSLQPDLATVHVAPEVLLRPGAFFSQGDARQASAQVYTNLNDLPALPWAQPASLAIRRQPAAGAPDGWNSGSPKRCLPAISRPSP